MTFGYLLVISSSATADYAKMAYALALSIKNTQAEGFDKVALVTDDPSMIENFNDPGVFDHVIEWDQETFWNGRSWMDKLSPFDATVCLDVDMLFLEDYSHWIKYFIDNANLYVANKSYTYRGTEVTNNFYRKTFEKNSLPNLYSFFTFFKKDTTISKEFFELGRYIIKNPIEFTNLFLTKHKPKVIGTDEAFALSAKLLDISDEIAYELEFPRVVHMKGMIQDWPWPSEGWSNHIGFYFDKNGRLKLGNYQQRDIVHYVEKTKITDELINVLEEIAWKK